MSNDSPTVTRPILHFLSKSGPYSIIDDSFPSRPLLNPSLVDKTPKSEWKTEVKKTTPRRTKVVNRRYISQDPVIPKKTHTPKAFTEFWTPGLINIADFVTSLKEVDQVTARKPSPPRQPPKLRQYLHRTLLRQRQLSLNMSSPKKRSSEDAEIDFTSLQGTSRSPTKEQGTSRSPTKEQGTSRSPTKEKMSLFTPVKTRLMRGLVCTTMYRKDSMEKVEGFRTVGKSLDLTKSRPRTSTRYANI